jgi:CRP-like cAMP-binding protein
MIDANLLARSPLFAGLPEAHLAPFVTLAEEITCRAGDFLFREGEEASRLYMLLSGKVNVQVQPTSLTHPLTIVSLSTFGQLVGWSGFMLPNYYTASAVCQEDCCLLAFNGAAFNRVLEDDPALGFPVMRRIAEVISQRLRLIQSIVLKTMYFHDEQ